MFIIGCAGLFSWLLEPPGVPDAAAAWLVPVFEGPGWFLLGVNLFLFVVGMFVETSASMIVLAPILQDAAARLGIDGVHFGMVMVVNLALGMVTPPFGVNLFAAAQVAGIAIDRDDALPDRVHRRGVRLSDGRHLRPCSERAAAGAAVPMNRRAARAHLAACPVLGPVVAAVGPPRLSPAKREPYEALVRAVAHQQVHGRAAEAMLARLCALCPGAPFPPPAAVLALPEAALRSCGFSTAKITAIRGIAAAAQAGQVPSLRAARRMSDAELIARLTTLRGVGRWTSGDAADLHPRPAGCAAGGGFRRARGLSPRRQLPGPAAPARTRCHRRGLGSLPHSRSVVSVAGGRAGAGGRAACPGDLEWAGGDLPPRRRALLPGIADSGRGRRWQPAEGRTHPCGRDGRITPSASPRRQARSATGTPPASAPPPPRESPSATTRGTRKRQAGRG